MFLENKLDIRGQRLRPTALEIFFVSQVLYWVQFYKSILMKKAD